MTVQFFTFSIDGAVLNELLSIVVFSCAFVSFWLFVALATCFCNKYNSELMPLASNKLKPSYVISISNIKSDDHLLPFLTLTS